MMCWGKAINRGRNVRLVRALYPLLSGVWIVVVLTMLGVSLYSRYQFTIHTAETRADEALRKDLVYRHWNALYGGVYAPLSKDAVPNPYLGEMIDSRDVSTVDGLELTLINPAYMTRQVHELGRELYGLHGHITSLNLVRPENAPDEWESQALHEFERGAEIVSGLSRLDGEEYLRVMKPLFAEEACLSCHEKQGYRVGDVRGGLSASVPMALYWKAWRRSALWLAFSHGLLLLLGLGGIHYGQRTLRRYLLEREEAARRLADKERQYRQLVEDNPGMICRFLPGGEITFVNGVFCEQFGRSPDSLIGANYLDLVPPENRAAVMSAIHALTPEEPIARHEHPVLRPDGSTGWQQWTNRAIFDRSDEPVRYEAIGQDITHGKLEEAKLLQLSAAVNQSPIPTLIIDTSGRVTYLNHAFESLSGYTAGQLLGKDVRTLRSGETPEDVYEQVWDALGNGRFWRGTLSNGRPDGSVYEIDVSITPIRNSGGDTSHHLCIARDLSQEDEVKAQLKGQLDELSRWRDLTLDREERIMDLKREINAMLKDSGQAPKYSSVSDDEPG